MNFIDKDVLLQRINTQFWSEIENIINSAPSIDIVRCKECKWCLVDEGGCERIGMVLFADEIENHFCGYGERKESE